MGGTLKERAKEKKKEREPKKEEKKEKELKLIIIEKYWNCLENAVMQQIFSDILLLER